MRHTASILVASSLLGLAGPGGGAELFVGTEYVYPREYEVTPIVGRDANGVAVVRGGIVEPRNFETRMVGMRLSVSRAYAFSLGDMGRAAVADADPLDNGTTALMAAAGRGRLDETRRLLARRAPVNASNRHGSTALMGASAGGFADVVETLLEHRARVNARSDNGSTALMFAARNGHLEVIRLLLKQGANVNLTDEGGRTALMHAVQGGYAEAVRALAGSGASLNTRNRDGQTPLMIASAHEDRDLVVLLTRLGARR